MKIMAFKLKIIIKYCFVYFDSAPNVKIADIKIFRFFKICDTIFTKCVISTYV